MADEADSKSVVGNHVWVQVPLPALKSLDFTGLRDSVSKSNQKGNQVPFRRNPDRKT